MKEGMKNMDSFISWAGGKKALRGKIIKDAEDWKLEQARYQDCYHKVLIYILGISEEPKGKKGAVIKHAPFL